MSSNATTIDTATALVEKVIDGNNSELPQDKPLEYNCFVALNKIQNDLLDALENGFGWRPIEIARSYRPTRHNEYPNNDMENERFVMNGWPGFDHLSSTNRMTFNQVLYYETINKPNEKKQKS